MFSIISKQKGIRKCECYMLPTNQTNWKYHETPFVVVGCNYNKYQLAALFFNTGNYKSEQQLEMTMKSS